MRPHSVLVMALVFGSGAAGLAYEISWSRQLGLAFGQTARAAAIVLAAYFLGMAVGYAIAGRVAARLRRPLAGFAVAEAVAGLWAFAVPAWLAIVPSSIDAGLTRIGVALLVLLPGTTALGASLPFVAQALGASQDGEGTRRIARVYAVNLAGAVVGVAASTGALAPVGVVTTSWIAAAISITVGGLAWTLRGTLVADPATEPPVEPPEEPPAESLDDPAVDPPAPGPPPPATSNTLWLIAAAVSGLGTLAAQVLYMRLFSLVFHNSTYTFAAILLVVLLGLSLASLLGAWSLRHFDPRTVLLGASLVAAAALPLSVLLLVQISGLRYFDQGNTFFAYITGATGLVAAVVSVPVIAMGLILPLSWQLAGANERPGRVMGQLTTANTIAAAAGAITTSFVLLPLLDLWWSFAVVAAAYVVLAVLVVPGIADRRRGWGIAIVVVSIGVLGSSATTARFEGLRKGEILMQRFSGPYGWIDVTRDADDNRYIRQNIHYGLASRSSTPMELRQGHLPLLLHPSPSRVAFIGLATGVTASAALDHPEVERITVMELVPEVVHAARWFEEENAGLLDDPRVDVVLGDGRNVLGAKTERYDVIVADLFVPWESKTGYLYTVEHYEAVRERLADGGLFCQWIAGWQVGPSELDTIAQSMQEVFEHVAIWQISRQDTRPLFALVGVDRIHHVQRERLQARMERRRPPAVGRDYVLRKADDVVDWYVGDWIPQPDFALNTDEHPIVEFSAPITHRNRGQRVKRDVFWSYHRRRLSHLDRAVFVFDPPATPDERRLPR